MKALVLSGGKGTRLKPITHTGAKQLVPVANKPILFYVIENIIDAGIDEIGVVVSPETGSVIKETVEAAAFPARFTWLEQSYPGGLAHAVKISQQFLGESSFIMYLGDNLLQSSVVPMVEKFQRTSNLAQAAILLKEVDNPESFGVASLDQQGKVLLLEEKPKKPKSNLALVGVYLFRPTIHEVIANLKPSARGELEITDALQSLVAEGADVDSSILSGWWLDTGKKEDLLSANYVVLDDLLQRDVQGTVQSSDIYGRVSVAKSARIVNSTLRGPCIIGEKCVIDNSKIGPFTSIGADSYVRNASVDFSVLMGHNTIRDLRSMDNSLLGYNVQIDGGNFAADMMATLGEDSEVRLV